ncbi:hypothetical protein H6P81_013486 [Aristolochia fimbriata]|uniref:FHA domain-containing protein n=1 Tax=Aristolochia fimbriata TaxID=158543 RepID=A0AAV7EF37_ARIFI|nr:hypothetical protein H6P81_013486 [Aristolochia fimbriata]
MEIGECSKRSRGDDSPFTSSKKQKIISRTGFCYLRFLDDGGTCSISHSFREFICLRSNKLYSIGRSDKYCDFVFDDRRISKRHCQIYLDEFRRKILIFDGFFLPSNFTFDEIRSRYRLQDYVTRKTKALPARASLNGVFVNGRRVKRGIVTEASVGDEITFINGVKVGFVVERVVFNGQVEGKSEISLGMQFENKQVSGKFDSDTGHTFPLKEKEICVESEIKEPISRALFLLSICRSILQSMDPVSYIKKCTNLIEANKIVMTKLSLTSKEAQIQEVLRHKISQIPSSRYLMLRKELSFSDPKQNGPWRFKASKKSINGNVELVRSGCQEDKNLNPENGYERDFQKIKQTADLVTSEKNHTFGVSEVNLRKKDCNRNKKSVDIEKSMDHPTSSNGCLQQCLHSSPGSAFALNKLEFMICKPGAIHSAVSLPELLHPIKSIVRMFIATFTSDILWFLSHCEVPNLLPITIACHNTERCWSADPVKRTSMPYADYPNLVVVYPPFPEVIAFSKDRNKQGIACHHPKLLVLQRDENIRVIVTSANLVLKQWNNVTNTVWWQDFPSSFIPDYASLFTCSSFMDPSEGSKPSDFASQLAGFMASLLVDVPSQAHWVTELAKYDFSGASVHLVASIPGVHTPTSPCVPDTIHALSAKQISRSISDCKNFLGCVQTSVVGLSHRFHGPADANGAQLKNLAAFLGKCHENAYGMSEVVLRRISNIPADSNAVAVLVCDLDESCEGAYIQLGFLPKQVAKWVAPLCDIGFFSFSACIYPKEVLTSALGGKNSKVQLILYVSQGPNFSEMARLMQPEHVSSLSSLLACMERSSGLWRLQEVLSLYKWPESQETDFMYGSSSIGTSVNPEFLAAFSAAAGKRISVSSESQESDPDWGRWNASSELRKPSMGIIFPTIERAKNGIFGIGASRRLLSLAEKTWQRLRTLNIFHDAIPHPSERFGYPMHVKVARRRFQKSTDSASFGWVYCGSHNFSAAAWGQPLKHTSNGDTGGSGSNERLHICNYELGVLFVLPPPNAFNGNHGKNDWDLDKIILPFVMPAPRYRPTDRPATAQSMQEALAELGKEEQEKFAIAPSVEELMDVVSGDEEEVVVRDYVGEGGEGEGEEEKVYAGTLWSQVDSSELT